MGNAGIDPAEPVKIAPRTWWVGWYHEEDPFQCHTYLVEQGDQSVLIDPGSRLTFRHTLAKIEKIVPFSSIRWFVCQHQDPDITGALPVLDELVAREDARIVTHWRTRALLVHLAPRMPFWLIDEHDWKLPLEDRELEFVFTPYAHFAGAFCTFDPSTGVLFSSDLFGGFTEGFSLYAEDEGYFEAMRPFHEHYVPSREILAHAVERLGELPIRTIAPQHGSIIPGPLVAPLMTRLATLDCGLFLLAKGDSELDHLLRLQRVLSGITRAMVTYRDFREVARRLLRLVREILPVRSLEFWSRTGMDSGVLHLCPADRYRGCYEDPPEEIARILGVEERLWLDLNPHGFQHEVVTIGTSRVLLPLFSPERHVAEAVAVMEIATDDLPERDLATILEPLRPALQAAVEREVLFRILDLEKERVYERSIRDPLTGLYTRVYMKEAVDRLMHLHDREETGGLTLAMVDIDHFKSVNDTYGHLEGDRVLAAVAEVVRDTVRSSDMPVRFGGEEFAVFLVGRGDGAEVAERIRSRVEELRFDGPLADRRVTVSLGVATRLPGESLDAWIGRADAALYRAKESGRNRVVVAQETPAAT